MPITKYKLTPIEQIFLDSCLNEVEGGYIKKKDHYLLKNYNEPIKLYIQKQMGGYRVDFFFVLSDGEAFVVECDGHEWHEKTKEQVIKDNKRDRSFMIANIPVLRFSGSEIFNHAREVADEILINYCALRDRRCTCGK